MQPVRFHRRRLRHVTWVVLFAWVFALATGAANACVVTMAGPATPSGHESHAHKAHGGGGQGLAADEATVHNHALHAGHEHVDWHPHPDQPDGGKAGCLKFCSDESSALSKNGNPDFAQIPAAFLMDGLKVEPVPTAVAVAGLSLECPSAHGPPLVICLLRLTL